MKKHYSSAKILLSFLGIATFASLVGTVSGTLAWYSYSTRATFSYSGTSVSSTVQLEIGIKSAIEVPAVDSVATQDYTDEEKLDLQVFWDSVTDVRFPGDTVNHYYFAPAGSGMETPVINAYLKAAGHATSSLVPVTSGSYQSGDAFSLKKSPTDVSPEHDVAADPAHYAVIPFVFRVKRGDTAGGRYEAGQKIWLVDAKASAYDENVDGKAFEALRMHFHRYGDIYDNRDFILNPSDQGIEKSQTIVGGILDLTRDHFYDYKYDENSNTYKEILYGDYSLKDPSDEGLSPNICRNPDPISDINHSGDEFTTFSAGHREGVYYYENYSKLDLGFAEYDTLHTIEPDRLEDGTMVDKKPNETTSVCITGGDYNLGQVDITVYLEGWDHSIVDEELEHSFNLGLTFEINKLGA